MVLSTDRLWCALGRQYSRQQQGSALSKHNELIEVDECHPVVLVPVLVHAVDVDGLLEGGPRVGFERDEAVVDELLNL